MSAEGHVVTITELPDGIFDWECACQLIAGHDIHTVSEAAWDAVSVHERQDGGRFTLAHQPVHIEASRNQVALLAMPST